MKRKKMLLMLLVAAVFMSGCDRSDISQQNFNEENYLNAMDGASDQFIYEDIEYISDYDIGDDGTLYALQSFYEEDGGVHSELHCYSPDGTETANLGELNAYTVLWDSGKLYLTISEDSGYSFNSYDLKSGELTRLVDTEITPQSTVLVGDTLYYAGITEERLGMREFISGTDFEYDGTLLYCYKLGEDTVKPVDVKYPVAISKTVSGELCIYAADENGPYFMIGTDGKKIYNDLGRIHSFGFVNENNFVFCSDVNTISLYMGRLDSNSIYSELIENTAAYKIKVRSVYVYYISGFTQKLGRINCSAFDMQNEIIRFLSPKYTFNQPFSIGYMTDYKELDDESFSLAVLSQDNSYDIFMINSYSGFSSNIRDKGSFCPLNDVPNVSEYLDSCFPYLKEAATDKDGNIWMLPVRVDIPVIVYNEDACAAAEIDLSGELSVEELIALCEKAYESDYKNGYDVQPYQLTQNLFIQYMAAHNSFDTPELRRFAEFAKEKVNLSQFPQYLPITNPAMNNLYNPESEKAFLFSYLTDIDMAEWLSGFESFDFCAVSSITENAKPVATCAFITVNPSSSNLEAALNYVSDLAKYLAERENSFMLSDKSTYTANNGIESLYDIISDAEIGFNISEEVYFESYLQYLSGDLTLDAFIIESDRKLSAYLNE